MSSRYARATGKAAVLDCLCSNQAINMAQYSDLCPYHNHEKAMVSMNEVTPDKGKEYVLGNLEEVQELVNRIYYGVGRIQSYLMADTLDPLVDIQISAIPALTKLAEKIEKTELIEQKEKLESSLKEVDDKLKSRHGILGRSYSLPMESDFPAGWPGFSKRAGRGDSKDDQK